MELGPGSGNDMAVLLLHNHLLPFILPDRLLACICFGNSATESMFVLGLIARNVRSSLLEMAPPVVGRRIQDSEPIEIGEALGTQWFIAPVLLTARANRKCRNFLCRKPLPLMGGNEPHRPGSGCEPRLKRPGFWLADPVGRRFAYV